MACAVDYKSGLVDGALRMRGLAESPAVRNRLSATRSVAACHVDTQSPPYSVNEPIQAYRTTCVSWPTVAGNRESRLIPMNLGFGSLSPA
jgi:hypothetical protein